MAKIRMNDAPKRNLITEHNEKHIHIHIHMQMQMQMSDKIKTASKFRCFALFTQMINQMTHIKMKQLK